MEIYEGETDPEPSAEPVLTMVTAYLLYFIILLLANILISILLSVTLFCQRKKNRTFFNSLYGNLSVATFLFSTMVRPGTILRDDLADLPPGYCTLYVLLLEVETIAVPMMILMLVIERVIFLGHRCCASREKSFNYSTRMTGFGRGMMIILPWLIGFFIAFVKTFGLLKPIELRLQLSNSTSVATLNSNGSIIEERMIEKTSFASRSCYLEGRSDEAHIVGEVILYTLRSSFPFIYLSISGLFLLSWWRVYFHLFHPARKMAAGSAEASERLGEPCSMDADAERAIREEERKIVHPSGDDQNANHTVEGLEDEENTFGGYELPSKPTCSLIMTAILCVMTMLVVIVSAYYTKTRGWLDLVTQWLFFIIETTAVALPLFLFPEVRQICFCSKFCKK